MHPIEQNMPRTFCKAAEKSSSHTALKLLDEP
jgi:hypothetical protein